MKYSPFITYLGGVVCLCSSELIDGVVLYDENDEPVTRSRVRFFFLAPFWSA